MEYKYHPAFKHIAYFIISYMFLRSQKLMNNELLLLNSIILTLFIIILDHLFISGHITPFQPLTYEYINEDEIKDLEKKIIKDEKRKKRQKKQQNEQKKQIEKQQDKCQTSHGVLVHPNNVKCEDHSQYVRMENNLDNFVRTTNNEENENIVDYPEYMAYNE